jgi:hypothetical protein
MIQFLGVKSLVGSNYVRVDQVIAITTSDPTKCTIYLTGGVMVSCAEPAKEILARLAAAIGVEAAALAATEETS